MKRRLSVWLVVALIGLLVAPALALADPLIPPKPAGSATTVPLYDDPRFPPYAYTFEGVSQLNSIGHVSIYFWLNQLLVTKAWFLKLTLRMAEYALQVNFLSPFLSRASAASTALGTALWDGANPLVVGALSLSGLWMLLLYIRGRAHRVWGALGGTVLIVMTTGALLAAGPTTVQTANDLSRDLSRQIYTSLERLAVQGGSGESLVSKAGDSLWRTLVYEPWLTGEFGSDAGAALYGKLDETSFLARNTEARHLICSDRARGQSYCPWWQNDFLPQRMVIAGWTFLATLVVGGALGALSGGIILAQLTLLFLFVLAPLWLLLALWWPGQGSRLLTALWMRALGVLALQVVLAVTLGLFLLLSLTVTTAFTGWILQSLLLVTVAVLAIRYRTAWLEPAVTLRRWRSERLVRQEQARVGAPPQERRHTVQTSPTTVAVEQIPVFAGFAPPPAWTDGPQAVELEPVLLHGRPERQPPPVPRRVGFFRSEMQLLREELVLRERAERAGDENAPPSFGGEAAGAHKEAAASGAEGGAGGRPATPQRDSAVGRLPIQRPRS